MRFVFPIPHYLRGELQHASRLYAYPNEPEPLPANGFVILDSGAFHLAKAGKSMDAAYLAQLALHYEKYQGDRVFPIAPDEYLNPKQTLKNWEDWQKEGYPPVIPVLQCTKKGRYDWKTIREQAIVYKEDSPEFICFSNPGLRSYENIETLREIILMVRKITGAKHVHNLGAGWDLPDIFNWHATGIFDSIDSISYYNATHSREVALETAERIQERLNNS